MLDNFPEDIEITISKAKIQLQLLMNYYVEAFKKGEKNEEKLLRISQILYDRPHLTNEILKLTKIDAYIKYSFLQ